MRRGVLVAAATAGALVAGGAPTTWAARSPQTPACTVSVTAVSPVIAHRGEDVTLSGSGFICGGAARTPAVTAGGHPLALAGPATDGSLVVRATDRMGAVQVSVPDAHCDGCAPAQSDADHLLLAAPAADAVPRVEAEAAPFSLSGSGLDLDGHLSSATAQACGEELTTGADDGGTVAVTAPAHFCAGAITLRLSAFTDTTKGATASIDVPAGTLDTAMQVARVSATHAAPGEPVTVAGSGFGDAGTATLGGRPVSATWFDRAVEITPVSGSPGGEVVLVRSDGRRIDAGHLRVDGAPSTPPLERLHAAPADRLLPPTPSPLPRRAPVARPALALRPAHTTAAPGQDVAFTVTLTAAGAPLAGTPVDLAVLRAPGSDASVTPSLGVTDVAGRIAGLLHLSRRPGDDVVVVRAGDSVDQVTVAACCRPVALPASGAARDLGASAGLQRAPLVAALAACLVLFVAGFALNLLTGVRTVGDRR